MNPVDKELQLYDDFQKSLFEVAKMVFKYGQGEEIPLSMNQLRKILINSENQKGTVLHSYQVYETLESTAGNDGSGQNHNFQEMFDKELESLEKDKTPAEMSDIVRKFDELMRDDISLNNIIIPESEQEILDPWTKLPIKNQVKSKLCQHIYDKASVDCKIKSNKTFRCPYIGCVAQLTKRDLIFDNST